jgi:hypothetical protein
MVIDGRVVRPPREAESKGWLNRYFKIKEKDLVRLIIEANKGKFGNKW